MKINNTIILRTSLGLASAASAAISIVEHQTFNDNTLPGTYTTVGSPTVSSGALQLNGSSGLTFTGATPLTVTDNFGIEAIVNASSIDAFDFVLANSNDNQGYGILQDNGWQAIVMGQNLSAGSTVALDTEVRLAYVRDGGTGSLYVDGAFVANLNNTPVTPTQFNIGFNPWDGVGTSGFNGSITEVRLFTFTAGEFVTGDLLTAATVPEPSSTALLGLGGLALILRRRK